MNSASFISSKFQYNLSLLPNCLGETGINLQRIDGLIMVGYKGLAYKIKDKTKANSAELVYCNNMTEHMLYQLSVDNQKGILAKERVIARRQTAMHWFMAVIY
ncbi:hypothetical protein [Photorhabdus asymbiotica]|uniref:hypothetical protein n=1 Tax=Photorhabdus asymbiotica TaxID=291112 RepID=UPI003DA6D0D0